MAWAGINTGGTSRSGFGMQGGVQMGRVSMGGGFGNTGGFDVDTSGLKDLSKSIQTVVKDVNNLEKAIDSLTKKLTAAGNAAQGAFGGGQQGTNKGGLTTAEVSGGASYKGGSSARGLALGAAGELGAQWAGQLNAGFNSFAAGGLTTNLMAAQTGAIFGGSSKATAMTGGLSSLSVKDMNDAMSMLQQNNFLYSGSNSQKSKQLRAFLNQAQKLNPTMGATGAMHFANDLTSNQAMSFMQARGIASTGGGLFNAVTGGINNPSTVYKTVLEGLTGTKNLTPQKAKQFAQNSQAWQAISNNAINQMGLSSADVLQLRQYASAGMNLTAATKAINPTTGVAALNAASAKTARNEEIYQQSTGSTINMYKLQGSIDTMEKDFAATHGTIVNWTSGLAKGTSAVLGLASHLVELDALLKIASGKSVIGGLLGKGKGAAGTAGAEGDAALEGGGGVGLLGLGTAGTLGFAAIAAGGVYGGSKLNNFMSSHHVLGEVSGSQFSELIQLGAAQQKGQLSKSQYNQDVKEIMGDPTGSTTTQGLAPRMKAAVSAMMQANPNIKIASGHRTSAQQAYLYAAKGGRGVAKPGQSAHQTGHAADLGPPSQFGWIAKNASKFGLGRPAPRSEPWHVQTMGDPIGGSQVVSGASSFIGTSYVWGGGNTSGVSKGQPGDSADPNAPNQIGLDCSGLVVAVFGKLGITLPHSSQLLAKVGSPVSGLSAAQPGDLLLYSYGSLNDHVAIYIGSGQQIAAPQTGQTVQKQPIDKGHLSCIRRIVGSTAGSSVTQAAQSFVGTPSSDSSHGGGGAGATSSSLQNTFISMVNSGGTPFGGSAPGGGAAGMTSSGSSGSSSSSGAGSTTLVGGSSTVNSPTSFSRAVLSGLGLGPTQADVMAMNAWQQAEGQWGARGNYNAAQMHNPLNTRLALPGSSNLGGQTTSYPTWAEGVQATLQTIRQGNMGPVLAALKANDNLAGFSQALESTPWASSHYEGRTFPTPSGIYAMGDPVGSMGTSSTASAPVSITRGGAGGRSINVQMNIYPQQLAASDIQGVVAQLMNALKSAEAADSVSAN